MCSDEDLITAAAIADHDPPHHGNVDAFWHGPLRSLCKQHHDSDKQRIEKGGKVKPSYGVDGWPIT